MLGSNLVALSLNGNWMIGMKPPQNQCCFKRLLCCRKVLSLLKYTAKSTFIIQHKQCYFSLLKCKLNYRCLWLFIGLKEFGLPVKIVHGLKFLFSLLPPPIPLSSNFCKLLPISVLWRPLSLWIYRLTTSFLLSVGTGGLFCGNHISPEDRGNNIFVSGLLSYYVLEG